MKNQKNAIIYGAGGALVGYGVAKFTKLGAKKHMTLILIIVGAAAGGYLGNKS